MTNNELFSIVRQIVMYVTGLGDGNIVIRDPNIGSPPGEYCSVEVSGTSRRYAKGGSRFTNVGPISSPIGNVFDVNQEVRQSIIRDVSLNFYRGNANDYAVMMLGAKQRTDVHNLLLANNVGWISTGPVNDLTALQSNQKEARAEVTITVSTLETQNVTSNAIYQSTLSAENETGTEVAKETITVPPE